MTNDLTTLQGALYECKDRLISELANKGVTASYSSTTGLLGLIHKISDIQSGELIVLTTNKSILSYSNSETATLTATHSLGAGQSVSVYNAVSGAKIGDMTDNQDGTYSYTYTSTGNGANLNIKCVDNNNIESNIITVKDRTFADESSSNKLSQYTAPSGCSMSYNSTEKAYEITLTTNNTSKMIYLNNLQVSNNCSISMDFKLTQTSINEQIGIGLKNNSNNSKGVISRCIFYEAKSDKTDVININNTILSAINYAPSPYLWWNVELIFTSTTFTLNLRLGNDIIVTTNGSQSELSSSNQLGFYIGWNTNSKAYVKNIIVQEL